MLWLPLLFELKVVQVHADQQPPLSLVPRRLENPLKCVGQVLVDRCGRLHKAQVQVAQLDGLHGNTWVSGVAFGANFVFSDIETLIK